MDTKTLYHVTTATNAADILINGFEGGWGDVGFGVYLYDNFMDAEDYLHKGGWDGELTDGVVIEVSADPMEVENIIPDPEWPNPEDYETVMFRPMDEGNVWTPAMALVDHGDPDTVATDIPIPPS